MSQPWPAPPDPLALQRRSFARFVQDDVDPFAREDVGIHRALKSYFPITSFDEQSSLTYKDYCFGPVRRDADECRRVGATYARTLRVGIYLMIWETRDGERVIKDVREQEIMLGEIPWMTPQGTFVIDGVDRVLRPQLGRCPGVHVFTDTDDEGHEVHVARVAPRRGPALTFRVDHKRRFTVQIGARKKIPGTIFLRAMGMTAEDILGRFYGVERVHLGEDRVEVELDRTALVGRRAWCDVRVGGEALVRKDRRFRKNSLRKLIEAGVTRIPIEVQDLWGRVAARDVIDENTAEVLVEVGQELDACNLATCIIRGIRTIPLLPLDLWDPDLWLRDALVRDGVHSIEEALAYLYRFEVFDEGDPDYHARWFQRRYFSLDWMDLTPAGRLRAKYKGMGHDPAIESVPLDDTALNPADVRAAVARLKEMRRGYHASDDLEHLEGAVLRCAGDHLEEALAHGLRSLEMVAKERLSIMPDIEQHFPDSFLTERPITKALRELFTRSPASERAELGNPAALVAQSRGCTTSEPDPRNPRRSGFTLTDTHPSQYGFLCPTDGLDDPRAQAGSLALYADRDERGFLQRPARRIIEGAPEAPRMFSPLSLDAYRIRALDAADGGFPAHLSARRGSPYWMDYSEPSDGLDVMEDVAPDATLGALAALVTFAAHDEAAALTAGARNLREAVPVERPRAPHVGTGLEPLVASGAGLCATAPAKAVVTRLCATHVELATDDGAVSVPVRRWHPHRRSSRAWHERVRVRVGDAVTRGQALTDGPGVDGGELALGRDVLAAVMSWRGYTDEGGVVVSERVVAEGRFTSAHVTEVSCTVSREGGVEVKVTRDVPGLDRDERASLDDDGLVRVGTFVRAGDVLAGRVMVKTAFDEATDVSLRVPRGVSGVVTRAELVDPHVSGGGKRQARARRRAVFWIAQRRALSVGDLLGTRHGTRAAVTRVVPEEDMPLLPDGRAVEVILSPSCLMHPHAALGNMYEMLAGATSDSPVRVRAFERVSPSQWREWCEGPGAGVRLRDGCTGELFTMPVLVGALHALKLSPCVEEVFAARGDGARDGHTGQPVVDARHDAGQTLGEEELWALMAYGSAHTLREAVTVRADDVPGAARVAEGDTDTQPGSPRNVAVLMKELQALGLNVDVVKNRARR